MKELLTYDTLLHPTDPAWKASIPDSTRSRPTNRAFDSRFPESEPKRSVHTVDNLRTMKAEFPL